MKNKARRKYKKYSARTILLISAFATQAALTVFILIAVNRGFPLFWVISFLLSAVIAFIVVNQEMNPDVKLALVIPILLVPVLGGFMYLLLYRKKPNKGLSEQEVRMYSALAPLAEKSRDVLRKLEDQDETAMLQFRYLCLSNNFPVYENTAVEYLSPGESFFERLKEKLGTAERSIYMEYFIIQEGVMWNDILNIMVEKAKAGVDVRLIYDDMGCLKLLPDKYDEQIRALGIRCRVYNHLGPLLSAAVNMRDHRKITVVDGHVAFTGGTNLADEYINENRMLRYWKDASIMLEGDAAQSFTIMFLSLWDSLEPSEQTSHGIIPEKPVSGGHVPKGPDPGSPNSEEPALYGPISGGTIKVEPIQSVTAAGNMAVDDPFTSPYPTATFPCLMPTNMSYSVEFGQLGTEPNITGFVAPYADIPSDREPVGENVYLNLISGARKYIHICTPYFIPSAEMLAMLFLAAKNGVDVKIVTPLTPDNWNIHLITRSYYRQLIENGIEVYEYSPGFIHSKTVVSDQKTGVVGSVNFDFRSLFFHHECAVLVYRTSAIAQMDRDFEEILGASRRITLEECLNGKTSVKIAGAFLRLFSPLF